MQKIAFKLLLFGVLALIPLELAAGTPQINLPAASLSQWEKAAANGFGDAHNNTIWSLLEFNNRLFAGTRNPTDGAEIWRSLDAETWTRIVDHGNGDVNNSAFASLFSILDDDLYLGTQNDITGAELWRSTNNGDSWDQFNSDGFGDVQNRTTWSGAGLLGGTGIHHVFAGTQNTTDGAQFYYHDGTSWSNYSFGGGNDIVSSMCATWYVYIGIWNWSGGQFWRYTWPTKTMDPLRSDGFGDLHNVGARSMLCLEHEVLIGTYNPTDGAEIWRYDEVDSSWASLASDGFDDLNNIGITSLAAYGDYLYAGTENNVTGAEIWRSLDGTSWEQANPDGFGNANNTEATSMAGFGPFLFVGTRNFANGAELWRVNLVGMDTSFLINADEKAWFPDVAYNSLNREYLVVWTYSRATPIDDPVYAQRLSWNGQLLGGRIEISADATNERCCADVAYDSANNRYLVSWHYSTSTEEGLRAQILYANGEKYGGVISIASGNSADNTFGAAVVGYSSPAQRFLAVYRRVDVVSSQKSLRGQAISAAGALDGVSFPISPVTNGIISEYDLAYNPSPDEFLVVWDEYQTSYEVYGIRARVYVGGGSRLGSSFLISDDTNGKWDWRPAVSLLPTIPPGGLYLVNWWLEDAGLLGEVVGRFVSGDTNTRGSIQTFSLKPKDMAGSGLDVAGIADGRFQVVWDSFNAGYYGSFIMGRSYGTAGDIGPGPVWQGGTRGWAPAIAAGLGKSYLVVYLDNPPGTSDNVIELWGRLGGISQAYLPVVRK